MDEFKADQIITDEDRAARRRELETALDAGKILVQWYSRPKQDFIAFPSPNWGRNKSHGEIAEHAENREHGFGWAVEIVDTLPPQYERSGLKTSQVVAQFKEKGYTHMQTLGGLVLLDKWKPYGEACDRVRFEIQDDKAVETIDPRYPLDHLMLGIWTPTKEA